jgi:hypothetical protein
MPATTGTVRINTDTIELPETEARALFLAAGAALRQHIPLVISPDVVVYINEATQLSLTIKDGFAEDYDPQAVIDRASKSRSVTVV